MFYVCVHVCIHARMRVFQWKRLTGHGAQVQILPDNLLQLAVHGARSEALTEIQPQVLTQRRTWGEHTHTHTQSAQRTHISTQYTHLPFHSELLLMFYRVFLQYSEVWVSVLKCHE